MWKPFPGLCKPTKNRQKAWAENCKSQYRGHYYSHSRHSSGNAAFDDYRSEQLKRLDEERRRLDEEVKAFHEYLANLNKAKDREEFDRFMRDRNSQPGQGFSSSAN